MLYNMTLPNMETKMERKFGWYGDFMMATYSKWCFFNETDDTHTLSLTLAVMMLLLLY